MHREGWTPHKLAAKATGSREGWWDASNNAEAFLDQLVTWREVGYNFASHRADYNRTNRCQPGPEPRWPKHARDRRE